MELWKNPGPFSAPFPEVVRSRREGMIWLRVRAHVRAVGDLTALRLLGEGNCVSYVEIHIPKLPSAIWTADVHCEDLP